MLIVDDDAMIASLLAEILEDMGYHVCPIAATEDEAVATAIRCKPGLMIVDEQLREGTGTSAVERILLTGPIPYVFIGGASVHREQKRKTVLQKPFLALDLVQAIRNAVGDADAPSAGMIAGQSENQSYDESNSCDA